MGRAGLIPALFYDMHTILFILYDSIFNSVFVSQVVAPLQARLDLMPGATATIISFERTAATPEQLTQLCSDPRIHILTLKKIPFIGTLSLRYAAWQLQPLLQNVHPTQIIARGPLAGWIACKATDSSLPLIVQARGLAAAEYLYAHQPASWWHKFRAWQYNRIEKSVYGNFAQRANVTIHTVSEALRDYLITEWHTPQEKVSVAHYDIPASIAHKTVQTWRMQMRSQLNITQDAYVYVYNGSAHAWQCPEQTIAFFAQKYHSNRNTFLLILTQSADRFAALLHKHSIPETAYHITCVPHADIYRYLAIADAGLLFREQHCINWVSRPTKALEYQSVGLPIIHNDTIEMLTKKKRPSR